MERKEPARSPDGPPVLLTIPATAQRLAVSPMIVRRLIEEGALKTIRFGRSVRVTVQSVSDLVEHGTTTRAQ